MFVGQTNHILKSENTFYKKKQKFYQLKNTEAILKMMRNPKLHWKSFY